jgi:hypothetical protein
VLAVKSTDISFGFSFSKQNLLKLIVALFAILVWVYLSGIGKFVWQNGDHPYRNAIFKLLVEREWPVARNIDGLEYRFVYYFGFWLPAALFGKVFGLYAGFIFQYFWAVFGVCCMFLLVCAVRKRVSLTALAVLVFFSGLDYIGTNLTSQYILNPVSTAHTEWWGRYFQYSSMTTQLFWVFNQIIPAWVAVPLVLAQKSNKNIVFILGTLFLNATFPFMGLLPIAAYRALKNMNNGLKSAHGGGGIFSFQNIAGGGISGMITFLFFASNALSSSFNLSWSSDKKYYLVFYAAFFVLEAGVYLALLWKSQKTNPLYYIITACLLIFPLFYIPDGNFVMRASIPPLFVLMLMVIDEIESPNKNRKLFPVLVAALLIGGITPLHEIARTIFYTMRNSEVAVRTEEMILRDKNFMGDSRKFFFRYMAKKEPR